MKDNYFYKVFGVLFIEVVLIAVLLIEIFSIKKYDESKWVEAILTETGVKEEDMTIAVSFMKDFMADYGLTKDMYDELPGFKVDYFPDQNNIVDDGFGLMFTVWNDDLTIDFYNTFYVRTVENTSPLG